VVCLGQGLDLAGDFIERRARNHLAGPQSDLGSTPSTPRYLPERVVNVWLIETCARLV